MSEVLLEHVNVTVSDPKAMSDMLVKLFGWHVRWEGEGKDNGYTIHVGGENSYVALYTVGAPTDGNLTSYQRKGGLNHIGVVVEDLDATEARVVADGYEPHSHGDYEPGRRFYFNGPDGIEIEVVSYA